MEESSGWKGPKYNVRVGVLWLVLFMMSLGTDLGSGLTTSLLLARLGATKLGYAFVIEAGLRLLSALGYMGFADRISSGVLLRWLAVLNLVLGTVLGLASLLESSVAVLLFYCVVRVLGNMLTLHWGVYLIDFFTVREANRAFPLIYSATRVSVFVSGFALTMLSGALALPLAVGVYILAAAGMMFLVGRSNRALVDSPRIRVGRAAAGKTMAGLREAWNYGRSAPLVRYMIAASVTMVLVRRFINVGVGIQLETTFVEEQAIREFLGIYMMIASAAAFIFQGLLAGRIIDRLGSTLVNAAYGWLSLAAGASMALFPGLPSLVLGQVAEGEAKDVFKTPVTLLHYGTFPDGLRGRMRSLIFGMVIPLATMLAGGVVMVMDGADLMSGPWFSLAMIASGALFAVASHFQNRGYRLALIDLLAEKVGRDRALKRGSRVDLVWDSRFINVRDMRRSGWFYIRRAFAADQLATDLFSMSSEETTDSDRRSAAEDLLMLVELFRPRGAPWLRSLVLAALEDPAQDIRDNGFELIKAILPRRFAAKARVLFEQGLLTRVSAA